MFMKISEGFSNLLFVGGLVLREDENINQVDHYENIEQINEDSVDKLLEC